MPGPKVFKVIKELSKTCQGDKNGKPKDKGTTRTTR